MKAIRGGLGVALVVLVTGFQVGCKGRGNSAAVDSSNGAVGAPSASAAAPTDTTTPIAAPPGGSDASSAGGDAALLAKASAGDSAEVALASFIQQNTTDAGVKSYAALLERDHGKGMSKVEQVAKTLSVVMQLPSSDTTVQGTGHTLDHLKALSGRDRDTAFVNHEIADHEHDIEEAKQMESQAQAPAVKALFKNELPELQRHLTDAKKLAQKLGPSK